MNIIANEICYYVLLFFVFSVLGWCMEVTLKYFEFHRFINRGFLIGPYCPIYGAGAVFVTLTVGAFAKVDSSYGATFVISFIVCGILEYAVSYFMEKRFHARWWDYSQQPMNLNGRVWIGNLVLFGIGGTIIIKIADPILFHLFSKISQPVLYVSSGVVCVGMLTDYLSSHFIMKFVKTSVEQSEADNTESIGKEIRMLLSNKSILYRRIADAYPNVTFKTERIAKKMQEVKERMEQLKEEAISRAEEVEEKLLTQKENIASLMESTAVIRDEIIQKQDELIMMLESGDAKEEILVSKRTEINARKKQLENKKKIFLLK